MSNSLARHLRIANDNNVRWENPTNKGSKAEGSIEMPLPNRKPPTANPNAAQQPPAAESKGKSRLPAPPQGGLKTRKQANYIDLPKDQDKCFYLLRLEKAEQFTTEKTRLDKVKHEFTVLDTDARGVRAGSTVTALADLQGERSLYFWQDVAPMWITLSGGEISDEAYAELMSDNEATFTSVVDENGLAGCIARVNLKRGRAKDSKTGEQLVDEKTGEKKTRVYKDWEPATAEELAKYGSNT